MLITIEVLVHIVESRNPVLPGQCVWIMFLTYRKGQL